MYLKSVDGSFPCQPISFHCSDIKPRSSSSGKAACHKAFKASFSQKQHKKNIEEQECHKQYEWNEIINLLQTTKMSCTEGTWCSGIKLSYATSIRFCNLSKHSSWN